MSQIFLGSGRTNPRIPCSTHTRLLQPKRIQLWVYNPSSDVVVEGLDLENLEKNCDYREFPLADLNDYWIDETLYQWSQEGLIVCWTSNNKYISAWQQKNQKDHLKGYPMARARIEQALYTVSNEPSRREIKPICQLV